MEESDAVVVQQRGVVVRRIEDRDDAAAALSFLDRAEAAAALPLVDEAERRRLEEAAGPAGAAGAAPAWRGLLACAGGRAVGYGGLVEAIAASGALEGDVAPAPAGTERATALAALLEAAAVLAGETGARRARVWLRGAGEREVATAARAGFAVERRLAVLGRDLDVLGPAPPVGGPEDVDAGEAGGADSGGVTVRAYRPHHDDEEVVRVLAAAYAGTPEAGWDLAQFRARTELPWFRAEDLLVAVDAGGRVLGLHWLKRRSATVGEVHNLAVDPAAAGRGLGPLLLGAGLTHLAAIGCDEVLLWVDRANVRAVRLYERHGFATRWEDVALAGDSTAGSASPDPR